jgi:hypothetical protein
MQTPYSSVTAPQLARLSVRLAEWHANRGAILYGSQLGQFVGDVIRPMTVRGCGGLKELVERELRHLVEPIQGSMSSDLRYRILVSTEVLAYDVGSNDAERQISGVELWRLFSNPRLTSQIASSSAGDVIAAPADWPLSPEKTLLRKLTSDDYRLLAGQFAASWPDEVARERMQSALQTPDFYNAWIDSLRQGRTADLNPLKQWEITRAEHVARKLGEELGAAGVDGARAAEIVASARPNTAPRASRTPPSTLGTSVKPIRASVRTPHLVSDDTQWMRDMLHQAIDKMDLSELCEIRIPAGLLLEISRPRRA